MPPLFRPQREGLDQAALEALRQQLHRVTQALDAANGNVRARLGDATGATEWTVANTAGEKALSVDSAGNLTVETITAGGPEWVLGEFVEVDPLDGWILKSNVITITAAYTVTASDCTILCDATAGAFDVLLPDAATVPGQIFNIKRIDATTNAVGITTTGGQTIDAYVSGELGVDEGDNVAVQSDGADWRII